MMKPFLPVADPGPSYTPPFDIVPYRDLYPFRDRWMVQDGLTLHYVDEGAGEPLVMVHGNPTWSFHFRSLLLAFSPSYRTIAPDHIGCGLSSRPDEADFAYTLASHVDNLIAFLDALALRQKVTLILHDWGGMIGMGAACRRPDRIGRICLLNTGAFLIPPDKTLPAALAFIKRFPLLPTLFVQGFNAFSFGATYLATAKPMPTRVRRGYRAPYNTWKNRLATLRFVQDIPATPADDSYALTAWVDGHLHLLADIPLMICWGEKDFVFDAPILAEWRRRFPSAEVHTFPRGGHYLLEDEPAAVVERIADFLERHPLEA